MLVTCSTCSKRFNIPDERLPMGKKIAFPCPACKETIRLDLTKKPVQDDGLPNDKKPVAPPTGEALKQRILRHMKDLPPIPQTIFKAREIMANPDSDFKELANLFETDQAIAAKILKIANSPYYGYSGKITSIQRASVILGHKTLVELLTVIGTAGLLGNKLEGYWLDSGALWKHSLAVAFGSRIIANTIKPALSNDAFTSGLIHDVGKLILDQHVKERWELFQNFMDDGEHTFLEAEKKILDLDHAEVASEVCKKWNIPEPLTVAIRYHHHPSQSNGSELAYIVHVADAIAMMTSLGMGIDGTLYQMDDTAMEFLNLREENLNDIMGQVLEAVQKIAEQ
ncbi:MAG TPA: HDOD domain-containing protein [Desulfobacterales bacterium]|nr:HDOD domain-containing protein [Desulfobacterales bacterium]